MTQKNGRLTFTILSISLLTVMAGAAMAPALGVIRLHFADQSSLIVQLIVSLPALTIIITNLFFPLLCRLMRTRTIAVSGLCMYFVFEIYLNVCFKTVGSVISKIVTGYHSVLYSLIYLEICYLRPNKRI